jgi:hypothetical protein
MLIADDQGIAFRPSLNRASKARSDGFFKEMP